MRFLLVATLPDGPHVYAPASTRKNDILGFWLIACWSLEARDRTLIYFTLLAICCCSTTSQVGLLRPFVFYIQLTLAEKDRLTGGP